jgi:hypothetical protein
VSETVALYRVVGPEELADLRSRHAFRTAPGHTEVKWFWTSREDAERYARQLERIGLGPNDVVEVRVRPADAARMAAVVADSRPARTVDDAQLTWFNECIVQLALPDPEPRNG